MEAVCCSKLVLYIDCVSPYSWFAFTNCLNYRRLLSAHDVEVEIVPFFLGAARQNAKNPFKAVPEAKARFTVQDTETTGKLLGLVVKQPTSFPISSLLPVRLATLIKHGHPSSTFEKTFMALASGYWSADINISTDEGVRTPLSGIFTSAELDRMLRDAVLPDNKERVLQNTNSAHAFGAPWFVCTDRKGQQKSWFGNDRWNQIFDHIGVPFKNIEIIPPNTKASGL